MTVTATRHRFGTMPDGRAVAAVTLADAHGVAVTVIALGASLQSVILPDRHGHAVDVAPGYATPAGYCADPYFLGATIGRVANRIANAAFTLDGRTYRLTANNGAHSLHGGGQGFDKAVWEIVEVAGGPVGSVTLRHVSRDGDMGYPGELTVEATYALDAERRLTIDYRATADRTTIVNLTNHAYWNLAGEGTATGATGHVVTIPADRFTPTDATAIPTGEIVPVAGTALDFRTPRPVAERLRDAHDPQIVVGRGYDHNWVFADAVAADLHRMAQVVDPGSGRGFELWSNQPGMQFYSGNFLDGTVAGKAGRLYRQGDAIAFEPQIHPDAPNRPGFPSPRLEPEQTYRNRIEYRFFAE